VSMAASWKSSDIVGPRRQIQAIHLRCSQNRSVSPIMHNLGRPHHSLSRMRASNEVRCLSDVRHDRQADVEHRQADRSREHGRGEIGDVGYTTDRVPRQVGTSCLWGGRVAIQHCELLEFFKAATYAHDPAMPHCSTFAIARTPIPSRCLSPAGSLT
jgi:hypothetical protein